ncbi:MAG: hypothetical protein H6Q90_6358, partial [Deltaproteobacteria bacterium]|nr:hypothetical protein [Deltaproteobacteria bacterium]
MRSLLGLVIVLGACGDDGVGKLPDAPFAPDASTIDASTSGVVTLTVTSDGVGVADVKVYFQNADSTVVAAATTDASGVASATMEPGGFVTAKDPFITFKSRPGDLRTFAGVKPGDQLVLQQRFGQSIVNVNVIVPVDPNATSYLLYTSCGQVDVTAGAGSGLPTAVSLFGCGATADFVVETRDPNGIALQAFAHPDITLVEGGTIDLSADTYVAPENVTWSYTNVPAGIGSVSVDSILASSHGPVVQSFSSAIVTNGTATTAPLARAGLAGSVAITLSRALSGNFSSHSVVEWGPATVTYVLDMASLLLADYEAAPTFDAAAHAVAWTATGAGAQPDFVTTQVTVVRINDAW